MFSNTDIHFKLFLILFIVAYSCNLSKKQFLKYDQKVMVFNDSLYIYEIKKYLPDGEYYIYKKRTLFGYKKKDLIISCTYLNWQKNGTYYDYTFNKQITYINMYTYKDGMLNGTFRSTQIINKQNDTIVLCEGYYLNDKKEGLWQYYNNEKIITLKENYKEGKYHGLVLFYENGICVREELYENGDTISIKNK